MESQQQEPIQQQTIPQILLLKHQWILAKVEEIEGAQFGDPDCILVDPMEVTPEGQLKDWLHFSDKKETVVRSSDIITFIEPGRDILSRYYGSNPEVLTE